MGLVALVLVAFAALAVPGPSQARIKIGVVEPLSGPVAASGNYVRMGAEIASDWINARGGIGGRKLELRIEDNKSDPKEAASAVEKLIVRDRVPAIMGAWGSSMTLAAMPKLEEYGVPMVDRKSTRLNSSHSQISYAVFCLKKKDHIPRIPRRHHPSSRAQRTRPHP